MTATFSMQRLWLAALCLLVVAVVPCGAKEVKLIDRKTVAHGAEVVMEVELEQEPGRKDGPASFYRYSYRTKAGIDWVFYREPVDYKKPYDWTSFEKNALPALKFNDQRVSLFLIDWYDCLVVTVDIDPAAPKVYEDRFSDSYGHGLHHAELVGADELELTDPDDRIFTTKRLKRDRDGAWWFAGIPYEKKCWSRVLVFTREYQLSQVLQNPPAEEWVAVKPPSGLRIIADPFSEVFSAQPPPAEVSETGTLPANMAKLASADG